MADVKAVIRQTNVGLNQPIYRLFVRPGATISTGGGGGSGAWGGITGNLTDQLDLAAALQAIPTPNWIDYDTYTGDFTEFPVGALLFSFQDGENFVVQEVTDPGVLESRYTLLTPTWDSLPGKPSTFPPSAHSHVIADVSGLQTALDGLQTALDGKQGLLGYVPETTVDKNQPGGYAGLDVTGKINPSQLPAIAITDRFVVASEAAMLALTAETGDIAIRTDVSRTFILSGDPTVLANWQEMLAPTDAVSSVFGRSGVVTAQAGDYTTALVTESGNLYFTEARARGVNLTGYAAAGARVALAATDTVLGAFNKIGKWLGDLSAIAFSGSASDLTDGTLPAARFNDTAHGNRAGGTLHASATTTVAGFMSSADKTKLDGVAAGANNYAHPNHTGDVTSVGDGATTLQPAAITGKPEEATAAAGDFVLISDTSDAGALKKVPISGLPSGGSGAPSIHQATLDFGTPSVARRTFTVAHPGVLPTSRITMWQAGVAAPGRDVDENEMDQLHFVPVAGTDQITVYATCLSGTVSGSYVAQYQIGQAA